MGLDQLPSSTHPQHLSLMKWADATDFVLAKARVRPRLGVLPSPTPRISEHALCPWWQRQNQNLLMGILRP